ncbi:MAG: nitroreductase family protein [Candidatus Cloacimonetes bacterium HGW-Cloacimonetes-2]|jgi:nitroreductase|nr:MAG: nitroreductase family protein [Candidatus Cloacimonetes bacterium HGW-Cloacimonetes-2]
MNIKEIINVRKSTRNFLPDPVPQEILEEILEAGRLAPSAQNRQPWRYLVFNDNRKIRELAKNCGLIGLSNFFIKEAPLVIIACAETKSNVRINNQDYYLVDTAISFQQMILTATAHGLGTCWMAAFSEKTLSKYLQLPPSWRIVAISPFGYPAEKKSLYSKALSALAKSKDRLPMDKIVTYK